MKKSQKLTKISITDQLNILRQNNRGLKEQLQELQEKYDQLLDDYNQLQQMK